MKIERVGCDFCGKESKDTYADSGWIQVSANGGDFSVRISRGRKPSGDAKANFSSHKILDFCCIKCLCSFIEDPRRGLPS